MNKRQHRCPYYLLKINKKEYDEYQSNKESFSKIIQNYQNQLNIYSNKLATYESIFQKIFNIIKPISNYDEPKSLLKCIEDAYMSEITKKNTSILVKKYIKFCNNKMKSTIESKVINNNDLLMPSIYDPENAYEFIMTKKPPYNRTTIKKHLNTLLRLLKMSTNNPYLSYSLPLGRREATKLKHLLTKEEVKKFIKYLNNTKHYIAILVIMLLYKFGVRIGSIAKIKCNDLNQDNLLIFKEKNNIIIRRILLNETSLLIRRLIKECNLKNDEYLFYNFKFPNDELKRANYFSKKIRNLMINSESFSRATIETISAHSFRVYHAVETFEGKYIKNAQEELGHKNIITTYNSYVKPEIRNLNIREEQKSFLMNEGKVIKKKKNLRKENAPTLSKINLDNDKEDLQEEYSFDFTEEGEDIIDDDFYTNENLFYFEGHFYDDIDFSEYQCLLMKLNLEEAQNKNITINDNGLLDEIKEEKKDNKFINNNITNFIFNNLKNKKSFKNDNNSIMLIGQKKDFNYCTRIVCENDDIISLSKVKQKKECIYLTKEDRNTLEKTIKLNEEGIFYNIKMEFNNDTLYAKATNNFDTNTLITVIGGQVFYYKELINNKIEKKYLKGPIIPYFRTAKKLYDRIIALNPISLVSFLFHDIKKLEENLEIKKIIDEKEKIILCVVAKKLIKKGEILCLDKNIIFSHYLNQ